MGSDKDGNNKLDLKKLLFTLKTAYFYKKGDVKEYAFAVEVDCSDAFPNLGFVSVQKLTFAIWDTKRNNVLKAMNLQSIDEKLGLLS